MLKQKAYLIKLYLAYFYIHIFLVFEAGLNLFSCVYKRVYIFTFENQFKITLRLFCKFVI